MMRALLALTVCLTLSACGKGENEPGPGGVTVGEARALDEAAQMLDERRLPPEELHSIVSTDSPASRKNAVGEESGARR